MIIKLIDRFFAEATFAAALFVTAIAMVEAGLQAMGYSLFGWAFSAGRFLDLAVVLLLFAVVHLLRQVRVQLDNVGTGRPE